MATLRMPSTAGAVREIGAGTPPHATLLAMPRQMPGYGLDGRQHLQIVVRKQLTAVKHDKQAILQLAHAADVVRVHPGNNRWRRFHRARRYAQYLGNASTTKPTMILLISMTIIRVFLSCPLGGKTKAPTQINDRDNFAAQIDDAFHKFRSARHLGDFHGADDFLNLQDIHPELFLHRC